MLRMTRKTLIILIASSTIAAVAAPNKVRAQSANERAVRAVVDSFFAEAARERWDSAAAHVDIARFEPFFKQTVANARSMMPRREMTVEELMARDSTMPRAVAEWQIGRMKDSRAMRAYDDLSYEFAGVTNQHALFALTTPQALSRWLEAQDERTGMREAWRQSGCSLASLPEFPAPKRNVLGIAMGNDSTAYVVQNDERFSGGDDAMLMGSEHVMILHRVGGRWLIQARRNLLRPDFGGGFGFGITDCPRTKR
jgi:hypothetical protein